MRSALGVCLDHGAIQASESEQQETNHERPESDLAVTDVDTSADGLADPHFAIQVGGDQPEVQVAIGDIMLDWLGSVQPAPACSCSQSSRAARTGP